MANFFDQFDTPVQSPPQGNFFDQFDAPAVESEAPTQSSTVDDTPWYAKAAQAADDMVRIAANGATFGYADKIAGALGGEGTDAERAATDAARERAGSASVVADVGGSLASMTGAAGAGATLAGRFGTGAMQGLSGVLTRTGLMGVEGAGYGALQAAGYDQDLSDGALLGAAFGAGGNVLGEALAAGGRALAGKKPSMSADDLRAAKTAAYQQVDASGARYAPNAFDNMVATMAQDAKSANISPMRHPKAVSMMEEIQGLAGTSPTLTQLDQLRQVIRRDVANATDAAEAFFGRKMIENIDNFIGAADGADMAAGSGPDAARVIGEARDLNTRFRKTEAVNDAVEAARLRAGSTGSGGNADNATRQEMRRLLQKGTNWTPDETDALETIIMGGRGQNALRLAGKLAPQGNGLMTALNVGHLVANPLIATPMAIAATGAKFAADRATGNNIDDLLEIIASGGRAPSPVGAPNELVRAIFATGLSSGRGQANGQ